MQRLLASANGRPVLLPVIHLYDEEQSLRNAQIAFDCGCHGVFLISHGSNAKRSREELLISCYKVVRKAFPNAFIGVNVLSMMYHPEKLFDFVMNNFENVDAIWTDQCFASPSGNIDHLQRIADARRKSKFEGIYFGGIAFKYQPELVPNQDGDETKLGSGAATLKKIAKGALPFVDVLITSGTKTGETPNVAKVRALHSVAQPLALSGAGLNLEHFAPVAEIFLSATALQQKCTTHHKIDSCASSFCELDESSVKEWVALGAKIAL